MEQNGGGGAIQAFNADAGQVGIWLGSSATERLGSVEYDLSLSRLMLYANQNIKASVDQNGLTVGDTPSFGGGQRVVFLQNAATVPSTAVTGGGVLYSEAGALKWRGSSGTVTVIAPA